MLSQFQKLALCYGITLSFSDGAVRAIADLQKHGIGFTDVVLVNSSNAKADVIARRGISFYIDDQPEMLKNIPANVAVMLFRNEGNFDFDERKWMFSNQTELKLIPAVGRSVCEVVYLRKISRASRKK